jgi:hypothetical protein
MLDPDDGRSRIAMRVVFCLSLIILSAIAVSPTWSQQRSDRVALVIANANYADASTPPSANALALAEEFRRNRFDVDFRENLGKSEMHRAIDALSAKISTGATALFILAAMAFKLDGRLTSCP